MLTAVRSSIRRYPRLSFLALGFLVALLSGAFSVLWLEIFRETLGLNVIHATRPLWLKALMAFMEYLPWLLLALLLVLRFGFKRTVHPFAFAGGIGACYVLVVMALLFGPSAEEHLHRERFDAAAWSRNDAPNVMWPARLTMVEDLLATHQLRGMSRDRVTQLLGPSDSTEYHRNWDLVYWLGPERGMMRIDSEWLVLRLGPDGRVSEHAIVRD